MAFRSCCLHLAPTSLEQGSVLSSSPLFLSMPSEAHILSESSWLVPQRDRWRHSNARLHYVWKHTAWPKKQACTGIFLILCLEFIVKNKQRKKKFKLIDVKHTRAVRWPASDSAFFLFFSSLSAFHICSKDQLNQHSLQLGVFFQCFGTSSVQGRMLKTKPASAERHVCKQQFWTAQWQTQGQLNNWKASPF